MTDEIQRKRRWPWIVAGGVALLAGATLIAALSGVFTPAAPAPGALPETTTQTPAPQTTPTPSPTPQETTPPPAARVSIPSTQSMPFTEVWTPPDTGEYFWQVVDPAAGYPATGGTDFVLAHACENQQCAGDELRTLEVGDIVDYKGVAYVIEESREIMKVDIAAQDIWYHDANRLVIITCIIETTWDQSDKNDLIIATRYIG